MLVQTFNFMSTLATLDNSIILNLMHQDIQTTLTTLVQTMFTYSHMPKDMERLYQEDANMFFVAFLDVAEDQDFLEEISVR